MEKRLFQFLAICILLFTEISFVGAQPYSKDSSATSGISQTWHKKYQLQDKSLLKNYPVRSIGPIVQGGRVTDLAVTSKPYQYYIAYASGGVFKTTDDGITFKPVFDNLAALTIGDIALAPSNEDILYVGTGEKNSSRSSYAGAGVYRSTDGAANWQHLGLEDTQHISRIIVHPNNPDEVWVAAAGSLYTHNTERGVYHSKDGGKSWDKTLFINDSTGIIDLVMEPGNPQVLYAAAWERTRRAWDFKGSGPNSGIYKSTDGGFSWNKLSVGWPEGEALGRIGLSISPDAPQRIYALLDNQQEAKEERKNEGEGLQATQLLSITRDAFLNLTDEQIEEYLKENGFPKKYSAAVVRKEIEEGKYDPKALAEYLGDANSNLFETKVPGAQVYRSDDAGESWKMVNAYDLEGVYYTYGYYFGEIRSSPTNADKLFVLGVPMLSSNDGGKNWYRVDTTGNVHVDHQTLWINPENDKHLMLGNDGGLYTSYNGGANWRHINNLAVGQFYSVQVDMQEPYNVYGGLQDNGVLMGSSQSVPNQTKNWERIMGGDGMMVQVDPSDANIAYTGYQFGNYYRLNLASGKSEYITPQQDIGEDRLRFNWRTPLIMSKHNPDILYMGAQKVYRTLDKGENWQVISPDLTKNKPQGNVPFSTLTVLAESPHTFGLLYAGTDDGNLKITRDGGGSWKDISQGLPQNLWVSSIQISKHRPGRVYATLTGYRQDDFNAYLFRSDDFGNSWTTVKGNLPNEAVNVLVEDLENESLLFVGTDHGTYASLDGGENWQALAQIPNVASYDMVIHPKEGELVIGTHGRSIDIADIKPLRTMLVNGRQALMLSAVKEIRYNENWGERPYPYLPIRQPNVEVNYYSPIAGAITFEVLNSDGGVVYTRKIEAGAGFNSFTWHGNLNRNGAKGRKNKEVDKGYLTAGSYTLTISQGGKNASEKLVVKESSK